MSKLAAQDKFLDFSDYGRPFAQIIANQLKNTRFTPVHLTLLFGVSGLIAVYCMLTTHYIWAGFFLILKSILDAADGELSRVKNTPSYTGRYLDSVFDIILNFIFLMTICSISDSSWVLALIAFLCIQLQGTVYNFYYVILRNNSVGGDTTSKIFETETPKAFPNESQQTVNVLFTIYLSLYGVFDRTVYIIDAEAYRIKTFPNWFMTMVSVYGLGFQLLIIAIMLAFNLVNFIVPFFIVYTAFMVVLIGIRRLYLTD
jgi:phosphatidylglycerophosphate synthase